jgi:hypothetical protein
MAKSQGMIVAAQAEATEVGASMLKAGGNPVEELSPISRLSCSGAGGSAA